MGINFLFLNFQIIFSCLKLICLRILLWVFLSCSFFCFMWNHVIYHSMHNLTMVLYPWELKSLGSLRNNVGDTREWVPMYHHFVGQMASRNWNEDLITLPVNESLKVSFNSTVKMKDNLRLDYKIILNSLLHEFCYTLVRVQRLYGIIKQDSSLSHPFLCNIRQL